MCQLEHLKELWIYGNRLDENLVKEYRDGISNLYEHLKKNPQQLGTDPSAEEDKDRQRTEKERGKMEHQRAKDEADKYNMTYVYEAEIPDLLLWLQDRGIESLYEDLVELGAQHIEDLKFLNEKDLVSWRTLPKRRLMSEVSKYFYRGRDDAGKNEILKLENRALQEEVQFLKDVVLDRHNFATPKAKFLTDFEEYVASTLSTTEDPVDASDGIADIDLVGDAVLEKLTQAHGMIQFLKDLNERDGLHLGMTLELDTPD
eukprot:TRINITY_DN9644_c0_g1_i4.p1 TRINITY_DN9644_c0_g1~~TRINITY_DN9644_c0_g1_i4.p1  ORF type:complete len:259 (-),score=71.75 TRINITY_DN9644_c0_g1_i4:109-885(-)